MASKQFKWTKFKMPEPDVPVLVEFAGGGFAVLEYGECGWHCEHDYPGDSEVIAWTYIEGAFEGK